MLQLVGLFGIICAILGVVRIVRASSSAEPEKTRKNGITILVFAAVLIGISLFGAPIAIKLSGL
jgi:hypothetical protein